MTADPRTEWNSQLVASSDSGSVVALDWQRGDLVMPVRMGHHAEALAFGQHEGGVMPTGLVTKTLKIDEEVMSKILDPAQDYYKNVARDVHNLRGVTSEALVVISPFIKRDFDYDSHTMDEALLEEMCRVREADAIGLPTMLEESPEEYIERLRQARLIVEDHPTWMHRMVVPSVPIDHPDVVELMAALQDEDEPFILVEWHGHGTKQVRVLRRMKRLIAGNPGDRRPFVAAFNVPRIFPKLRGSTPLFLAGYGVQATAYSVIDPKSAQFLAIQASEGIKPMTQLVYVGRDGGWHDVHDLPAAWADGCTCYAHDDALTDITALEGQVFNQRARVHEMHCHIVDRDSLMESIVKDALAVFIADRALLDQTVKALTS